MFGCRGGGGLKAMALLLMLLMAADEMGHPVTGSARELRPSDHGLAYQGGDRQEGRESPTEMLTFFGSAPRQPPNVALPRAMNSGDTAALWSQQQNQKPSSPTSRSGSSDRTMKEGLLVGSLVCGIIGAALLAASAIIFVFLTAKKPTAPLPTPPPPPIAALHPDDDPNNTVACIQPTI